MIERSERYPSKTSFTYKRIIRNLIKLDNVTAIAHIKRLFSKGGGVIMAQSTSKINLGLVSNQSNFLGCRIYTRCSNSRLRADLESRSQSGNLMLDKSVFSLSDNP